MKNIKTKSTRMLSMIPLISMLTFSFGTVAQSGNIEQLKNEFNRSQAAVNDKKAELKSQKNLLRQTNSEIKSAKKNNKSELPRLIEKRKNQKQEFNALRSDLKRLVKERDTAGGKLKSAIAQKRQGGGCGKLTPFTVTANGINQTKARNNLLRKLDDELAKRGRNKVTVQLKPLQCQGNVSRFDCSATVC